MIHTTVIPDKQDLQLQIPADYVGKQVEVLMYSKDELKEQGEKVSIGAVTKAERIEAIEQSLNKYRVDLRNFKFDRDEANDYD